MIYSLIQVFKLLSYLDIGKIHIAPFDSRQCLKCQIFFTATISSLPSPSPIIPFFFCFRPNFLSWKRLLRRQIFCLITRVANRTQSNSNRSIDFEWGPFFFFYYLNQVGRQAGGIWGRGGGHYAKKYGFKVGPGKKIYQEYLESEIHRIKSLKILSLSHNIMALDCVKSIFQDCHESLPWVTFYWFSYSHSRDSLSPRHQRRRHYLRTDPKMPV